MNTTLDQNRPQLNKFAFGTRPGGGGAGLLLYNGLMAMCRWMGSHFHDWIDNNGVPFSIVTRMGSHIFGFFAGYLAWENRRHFATPPPVSPAQIGELARRLVKVGHTTGVYVPYSFRTVVWVLLRPTRTDQWKCCETGPTSFRPYPRRLESLTIYRCHYKCSTFFQVILKTLSARPGRGLNPRPPAQQTGTLPTELTSAEEVFVMATIPLLFFQSHLATPEHPLFLH